MQVEKYPPGGSLQVPAGATRRAHIHLNPCRAHSEPSQTIVKRMAFRAQALENIAKRVVSLRHWTKTTRFTMFSGASARKSVRFTMVWQASGWHPWVLAGATWTGHTHRNPCRARPKPSRTIMKRVAFRAQASENIVKRMVLRAQAAQNIVKQIVFRALAPRKPP